MPSTRRKVNRHWWRGSPKTKSDLPSLPLDKLEKKISLSQPLTGIGRQLYGMTRMMKGLGPLPPHVLLPPVLLEKNQAAVEDPQVAAFLSIMGGHSRDLKIATA